LIATVGALAAFQGCSGSTEVDFHDVDAASGRGGGAGNGGFIGASGVGASTGNGGAGGALGTAGLDGSAGRGGTSGSAGTAGRGGASGSAGTAGRGGTSGSAGTAGRGGTSGSAGTAGRGGTSGSAGTAGGGGTSGSAGTSGTAGSGGAPDGGTCPSALPTAGSVCAPDGLRCSYGECCPTIATCSNGRWQVLAPQCLPPVCPSMRPRNGDACDPCRDGTQCRYDRCDSGNDVSIASCNAQTRMWQILSVPCQTPCGPDGMMCDSDEICVRSSGGAGFNFRCEDNPCAPQPVTCQCAAPVCGGNPWVCSSANDQLVTCSCLTCT
jgi:hypothetical protein